MPTQNQVILNVDAWKLGFDKMRLSLQGQDIGRKGLEMAEYVPLGTLYVVPII
jgi:hypothetical protein